MRHFFYALTSLVLMSLVSCVDEPVVPNPGSEGNDAAVASLSEQAVAITATVKLLASLPESIVSEDIKKAETLLEEHAAKLDCADWLEGTIATLGVQKEFASVIGALQADTDSGQFDELCVSAENWIGPAYVVYYEVSVEKARLDAVIESIDIDAEDQKLTVDALISDVEAGLRDDVDGLLSLSESVDRNISDIAKMERALEEMVAELETECIAAITTYIREPEHADVASVAALGETVSAELKSVAVTLNDLYDRVAACESALEEISGKLGEIEADMEELLGMIQSVIFVPEYATDDAVAYYNLLTSKNVEGLCEREPVGTIDLSYMVRPASAAAALNKDVVSVIGYYAKGIQLNSVAASEFINFEVQDVKVANAARGLVTVSVSHDLKEDFYFRKIGAKLCLSIVSGKTDITSKFVDLIPKDKSATVYVEGVTMSDKKVEMDNGETTSVWASVTPSSATVSSVAWSSSNTDIVTVDGGKLTAVGVGTATVTATSVGVDEWGLPVSATCEVVVHEAIRLAGPTYVEAGKTAQMTLDFPASLIVDSKAWWTSDSALASVDEHGVVTASEFSSLSLIYDSSSGGYKSVTVYCQINETVVSHEMKVVAPQPKSISVNGLSDNENEVTVKLGSDLDLSATINPANVAESGLFRIQYLAHAQSQNIAEIDFYTGIVKPKSPGTTYMYIDVYSSAEGNYFAPGINILRRTVITHVEPYWVTAVSLPETFMMAPEQTTVLGAEFASDVAGQQPSYKDLLWESSNPEIVSIDSVTGEMTALTEGTVSITATTSNAWSVPSGQPQLTAECIVTVKKPVDPVAVGDFYYSDGTWSSELVSGKTVIGVVFSTANALGSDPMLRSAYPGCSNGIVVGLKEYADQDPGAVSSYNGHGYFVSLGYDAANVVNTNLPMGYYCTEARAAYCKTHSTSTTLFDRTSGVLATHQTSTPSPAAASAWYIPSFKEMQTMYDNLSKVNESLSKAGGTQISQDQYWSSTIFGKWYEKGQSYDHYKYTFNMSTGGWHQYIYSSGEYPVRVVLAF